ncbi:MAG: response regulator, partial [Deltaproteobacteria bacterium]|nr:response regulator [Deltaproteobacteria bacterium]
VDDSKTIRLIIRGIIETLGYEPLEADCGATAMRMLGESSEGVALVLLDWNMPGMNGLEVLQAIKGDDGLKDIPVMMVTTEAEKSNIVTAIQSGASNYLTKPFVQEDLAAKIMECLGMGGI